MFSHNQLHKVLSLLLAVTLLLNTSAPAAYTQDDATQSDTNIYLPSINNGSPSPESKIVEGEPKPFPALASTLVSPTTEVQLHHSAPSTPWAAFAGASVNALFGNFVQQTLDLRVMGRGLGVALVRTYNSADITDGPLGKGWTHSYNMTLVMESTTSILVRMEDGRLDRYTLVNNVWLPPTGVFNSLVDNGDGTFALILKNQNRYLFDAEGRLHNISDRNGNQITLTYTTGTLAKITDSVGRDFLLQYDSNHRLETITDPLARTVTFAYDSNGNLASVTDLRGQVTTYAYDSSHRLITTTDANNHAQVSIVYDGQGRVARSQDAADFTTTYSYDFANGRTTVTDPRNHTTQYAFDSHYRFIGIQDALDQTTVLTYDNSHNVTSVTDKRGHTTETTHDGHGNVTSITDAQGNRVTVTYDAQHNPLTITNQRGYVTTLTYDTNGNLLSITDARGGVTSFFYDATGQVTNVTDAEGRSTPVTYDADGNIQQITDALNHVTNFNHDLVGRITGVTDPRTATTQLAYDATDNPTQVVDALGKISTLTYDAVGNRESATDAEGQTTTFAYDGRNLLISITDANGNLTRFEYDANGNRTRVIDANGNATVTTYDPLDRPIQITDALGNGMQYSYDANGNRTAVTDPAGSTITTGYDELNRPVRTEDSLGRTTLMGYDAAGNRITVTDPLGRTTNYGYDELNRLTSVTDALGNTVRYEYDMVGNRSAVVNARGQRTTYGYDALNRLISESDPLGNTVSYTYDANGNRTVVTDANNNTTTWHYDELNRIAQIDYPTVGGTPANAITFGYDAVGNRVTMIDTTGTTHYTYDGLNRLTGLTNPENQAVHYAYDAAGNRTRITYPDGSKIDYRYDAANRLQAVIDGLGETRYVYNARGQRTATHFANGVTTRYYYDAIGQVLDILTTSPTAGNLLSISYTYDDAGNRTQMVDNEGITRYQYDDLNRLTEAIYPDESFQQFSYDAAGNRLSMVEANGTTTYSYDNADRLQQLTQPDGSSVTFTWDANGNMTGRSDGTTYTWDAANRLTRVDNANGTTQFAYDGDGRRTGKIVNGVTTTYLWDTVAELPVILNERVGDVETKYGYGDELLSMIEMDRNFFYYHADVIGSIRQLSNADSHKSTSYSYKVSGESRGSSGRLVNSFQFTGQYLDYETNLYYLRARYYDPQLGLFMSADPAAGKLERPLSQNNYIYAEGSPVNYTDPTGYGILDVTLSCLTPYGWMWGLVQFYGRDGMDKIEPGIGLLIEGVKNSFLGCGYAVTTSTQEFKDDPQGFRNLEPERKTLDQAFSRFQQDLVKMNKFTKEYVDPWLNHINHQYDLLHMCTPIARRTGWCGNDKKPITTETVEYVAYAYIKLDNETPSSNRISPNFNSLAYQRSLESSNLGLTDIPSFGPVKDLGHSPNRPTPTENPGAHNWKVTVGNAPQICVQEQGDADGHAIVGYQFAITGAQNHDSPIVTSRCYTPPHLGYYSFAWRGRVQDASGQWSDWSEEWHYSVENPEVNITYITFEEDQTEPEFVFINSCTEGNAGVNISLSVMANTANDGSSRGDWEIIKQLGVPCFNNIDRPRWDTRRFKDGPHLIRVEARRAEEVGERIVDVAEAVYNLPHRKPHDPRLLSPSTGQQRDTFLGNRAVNFRWENADRTEYYVFYLSLSHPAVGDDPDPLLRIQLPPEQTSYTHTFDQVYDKVYWGVRAYNSLGYGGSDNSYSIGLDETPPSALVEDLPATSDTSSFVVNWSGDDNNSGVAYYDVQVRDGADGAWQFWQINTTNRVAIYPGEDGHTYYFRARAADNAGNLGSFANDNGDTQITVNQSTNPNNGWWNHDYQHRRDLVILNSDSHYMTIGYPLQLYFDDTTSPTAAELCARSTSATPGDDFRIVFDDTTELARQIKVFNCEEIDIRFGAKVAIPAGGSDSSRYKLYYGNAGADNPPNNVLDVYGTNADDITLAVYQFEEGSGYTAVDLSGNGHHGNIADGVSWVETEKFGSSLSFPGPGTPGGGIYVSPSPALNISAFTFEFFAKRHAFCNEGPFASQGLSGNARERWEMRLQGGRGKFHAWGNGEMMTGMGPAQSPQPDTEWHHVAMTFDGANTVRWYLDGGFQREATLPGNGLLATPLDFHIGENFDRNDRLCGVMDGVRLSSGVRREFPHAAIAKIRVEPDLSAGNEVDLPFISTPTPTMTPSHTATPTAASTPTPTPTSVSTQTPAPNSTPTATPTQDLTSVRLVKNVFASGNSGRPMHSSSYQVVSVIGQPALPGNAVTLSSTNYRHKPGFLALHLSASASQLDAEEGTVSSTETETDQRIYLPIITQ